MTIDLGGELGNLLKAGSLSDLLLQLESPTVTKEPRSTISQRQEALEKALKGMDPDKLIEMQETMSGYVDALDRAEVEFDNPGTELLPHQLDYLMRRDQDTRRIIELCDLVKASCKRIAFAAITAKVAAEQPDNPQPEYVSESLNVPSSGKRFCKEGAGRKPPRLKLDTDEAGPGLRELLGDEVWEKVCTETVIPEKRVVALSEERLLALAITDPTVAAKIESCLIPQGWNVGSYTVRNIK